MLLEGETSQDGRLALFIVRATNGAVPSHVILAPMLFDSELSLINLRLGLLLEVVEARSCPF